MVLVEVWLLYCAIGVLVLLGLVWLVLVARMLAAALLGAWSA
jgi:hypothetical protein